MKQTVITTAKANLKKGIYIPSIDAMWLYKSNKSSESYEIKHEYLKKSLKGKLDFSFELLSNVELVNNLKIKKIGKKLYTFDIINVTFNKVYIEKDENTVIEKKTCKELRDYIYENGIIFNGEKLTNWKRSSGKARVGENLFINDKLNEKALNWARMGLDFIDECDIASLRAYESLPLSSIIGNITINPNNILVVNDYDSIFNWKMSSTYLENGQLITKTDNVSEKNSIWDGEGLLDNSIYAENEILNNKSACLLRNRLMKCCCFNTNIELFYRDYCQKNNLDYNTYEISDMYGNPHKVSDIKLITTPNSIKLKKFNKNVLQKSDYSNFGESAWLKYWLDNCGEIFGVCKTDKTSHLENGKYNRTSYQMLNTIPFTQTELNNIMEKEKEHISSLKNDLDYFLTEINQKIDDVNDDIDDTDDNGLFIVKSKNMDITNAFTQLVQKNSEFQYTKVFKDFRRNYIDSYIRDLRKGKVKIVGDYATCCSCPVELLYSTVNEFNGKCIALINNQVYSPRFSSDEVIVGFRNPHVVSGNIGNLINKENELINRYMNLTNNVFVINSINYPILSMFSGEDFDSDTNLLTNEPSIVSACSRLNNDLMLIPVNNIKSTNSNNALLIPQNMSNIDHIISQNYIGQVINLSQEVNSLINHLIFNNLVDNETLVKLYSFSSRLSSISCVEIDKAKKQFSELNITKELNDIKSELNFELAKIGYINNDDARRIKPHFFKYIGDNNALNIKKTVANNYKKQLDKEIIDQFTEDFGETLDDVQKNELNKLLSANNSKKKQWVNAIYRKYDTPMDWLETIIDNIDCKKTTKTVKTKDLIKENKHSANMETVDECIKLIKKLNVDILAIKLDNSQKTIAKKEKIKEEKQKCSNKLTEFKVKSPELYKIIRNCYNKDGKLKSLESLTLEILFFTYGDAMLNMFITK